MDSITWTNIGTAVGTAVSLILGKVVWDKRKNGNGKALANGHVSTQEFREFKAETRDRFDTMDEKLDEVAEGVAYLKGRQDK